MEKSLTMPKLGMTMTEGTVLQWLYHEGDMVEKGEPIVEVMTDKVNMEVEAPFTGRLMRIVAQEGDILPIGSKLATFADDTKAQSTSVVETQQYVFSAADSASLPIASTPAAKREAALHAIELSAVVQAGAVPPLNRADVVAFIESRHGTTQHQDAQPAQKAVRATPVAQKIAHEHQIDLAAVAEQRPGQKVTRADVEAHLTLKQAQHKATDDGQVAPSLGENRVPSQQALQEAQDDELVPLSPVRRLIGQRMLSSISSAPHIYLDSEIDMTEAERCRQHVGQYLQKQDEPPPSLTAVLVRAVAASLVLHPEVNATLETGVLQGKDAIRRWRAVHIGVAVDTEQALLTPVIRDAHQQSIPALARELRRLTHAARQGSLKPEEMAQATFTISNLGMYGIDTFHAIIAPGQSAILAVGKVTKRGVVVEESTGERLEIRPMLKVSLSADHRVLDGASGSRFLHRLKTFLEDPYLLV